MADAIVSLVVERAATVIADQISKEVNLVRGAEKQLQSLSDELKTIRNVLDDAERKGYKDKSVKDWLRRLEHTSYEMDDVLDEWEVANIKLEMKQYSNANDGMNKVRSCIASPFLCFKKVAIRRDIAVKIEKVKAKLDRILAEKDRYGFLTSQPTDHSGESWRVQSTSLIDLGKVCGRDIERENLVNKLVSSEEGGSIEELGIRVLSIVGVGGLGKTTLAQLAYNDQSRVVKYFELRIWICVSDPFDEVGIAKEIIQRAGRSLPDTNQLDMLLQCLKEAISGKKFLLVMDDVWSEDNTKWEPLKIALKCGGAGSKVLVTTRNERVAIMMGSVGNEILYIEHLSSEDCWLLLSRIALSGKNKEECAEFHKIGKNIANRCKGLPLAAKTLGSLLRFKHTLEEWENVVNSEIWELQEVEVELFPHLLVSYNELSPQLKRCFSYCAVFPKDTRIDVDELITKWMALGYLGSSSSANDWELRGRGYFDKLATHSLFQDFEGDFDGHVRINSFKMHDILHDFARFLRKDINGQVGTKETNRLLRPLVSHAREFRSLFCDWEPLADVYDFVKNLRLLSLRGCGLISIPKEMEKLIHLRWLDLGQTEFVFGAEDLKIVFRLYNLQFLWLNDCSLQEIPQEIGNLIHLIYLDLSKNKHLKELAESICNFRELESLNIGYCVGLSGLPHGIHRLVKLKHLNNTRTYSLKQYPQGLAQLTGLRTLDDFFHTQSSKLGLLKTLNQLTGMLHLKIELNEDQDTAEPMVEDAREAELRNKIHIKSLQIEFCVSNRIRDSVWRDLIEAVEPHQNLQRLKIWNYRGSQFAGWIASPVNRLRSIELVNCDYIYPLPPLGKLPFLEVLSMSQNYELQFLGREFLGVDINEASSSSSSSSSSAIINTTTTTATAAAVIGFPKLKKLEFSGFTSWKEWEDISAEEEDSPFVSYMPCLTEFIIESCPRLTKLPHRLLHKAVSLKRLVISYSTQLAHVYRDKEGEAWKSMSCHNPRIKLLTSNLLFDQQI